MKFVYMPIYLRYDDEIAGIVLSRKDLEKIKTILESNEKILKTVDCDIEFIATSISLDGGFVYEVPNGAVDDVFDVENTEDFDFALFSNETVHIGKDFIKICVQSKYSQAYWIKSFTKENFQKVFEEMPKE